jgi:hypothetical protein
LPTNVLADVKGTESDEQCVTKLLKAISLEDVASGGSEIARPATTASDNERTAMQLHTDGGACR